MKRKSETIDDIEKNDNNKGSQKKKYHQNKVITAVIRGNTPDKVKALIEAGVEKSDYKSPSAFVASVKNERFDDSLLHEAVRCENVPVLEFLLKNKEYKVKTEARDNEGRTPLFFAIVRLVDEEKMYWGYTKTRNIEGRESECVPKMNNLTSMIDLLCDAGADIKTEDDEGWTLLHYAWNHGSKAMVEKLLRQSDIEAKVKYCETPLHFACSIEKFEIVKLLVEHGANIEARTSYNVTPIHAACCNSSELAEFLIKKGADFEATTKGGDKPLHYASKAGQAGAVELLISNGAYIDARNSCGCTPLIAAVETKTDGTLDVVKLLLKHNAYILAKDYDGKTALDVAKELCQHELVAVLQEALGAKPNRGKKDLSNPSCITASTSMDSSVGASLDSEILYEFKQGRNTDIDVFANPVRGKWPKYGWE